MKRGNKYLLVAMVSSTVGMIAGALAHNPALTGLNTGLLLTCIWAWIKWR